MIEVTPFTKVTSDLDLLPIPLIEPLNALLAHLLLPLVTKTDAERAELTALRTEADCFMLRKAQAAVLLRWRGHHVPLP